MASIMFVIHNQKDKVLFYSLVRCGNPMPQVQSGAQATSEEEPTAEIIDVRRKISQDTQKNYSLRCYRVRPQMIGKGKIYSAHLLRKEEEEDVGASQSDLDIWKDHALSPQGIFYEAPRRQQGDKNVIHGYSMTWAFQKDHTGPISRKNTRKRL